MRAGVVIRAAAAVAVIVAAALGVIAVHTHRERVRMRDEADYEALRRMDRYCDLVREGFRQDAADLRGDTVKQRENAADRFMEPVTLHSWNDVTFCSGVEPVVDKTSCWLRNDFECIAKQAESVAAMIPIAAASEGALPRLRQHCRHVHTTMGMAAREARDRWPGDFHPSDRLGTHFPTYSREEIELCAPVSPDLTLLDDCRARNDYRCIEQIALAAERAIPIADDP